MKKLFLIPAAALLLCLCACGLFAKPAPSPSPSAPAEQANRGETITTAPPESGTEPGEAEATPKPTPEPAPTFQPAPEGTQPTAVPIPEDTSEPGDGGSPEASPSPAPTAPAAPAGGSIDASGSFRSDTGTALNLIADWQAVSVSEERVKITVTLSLESYSLDVGERRGNTLTFNGEETSFITDPILVEDGFHKTAIYVWSKEVPADAPGFTLAAEWKLLGSYSRKEMESITLSGSWQP